MPRRLRNPFVNDLPLPWFTAEGVRVPLCGKDSTLTALVDPEDAHLVADKRWYLSNGYAVNVLHRAGTTRKDKSRSINTAMHRLVLGHPPNRSLVVDHINGDRLDNRKRNLRWVTVRENNHNLRVHREGYRSVQNPFGYMGVSRGKGCSTWQVRVGTRGYGHWATPELAAQVYDLVVRTLRPNQRALNFPKDLLPLDFSVPALNAPVRRAEYRSDVVGVSWFKPRSKWRVIVKKRVLGYFDTKAEAEAFREKLG